MRQDLLALSSEALAVLANVGLVKRAQRELAAGSRPEVVEEAGGTVVGTFEEKGATGPIRTQLPPGHTLKEGRCTCGALGVCRHLVALVFAYQELVALRSAESPEAENANASEPAAPPLWSPGEIDDDALRRLLGKRHYAEALRLRQSGLLVTIQRPRPEQPIPLAALPSCSVRFLAWRAPAFARCDCQLATGCPHVALAVWAFRAADLLRPDLAELRVELKPELGASSQVSSRTSQSLRLELLLEGAVHAGQGLGERFAVAREHHAGEIWIVDLLECLELELARYQRRSTLYRASHFADHLAELEARRQAHGDELPPLYLLGRGEKAETRLDRVRLVGLGARLEADGRERRAEVLLADPDSGGVLVCEKSWTFAEGESIPQGPELGRRRIAGSMTLQALAGSQLLTHAAKRLANQALLFGQMKAGNSSLLPQTGNWEQLPSPLRIERLEELNQILAERPPRFLRPRLRAEAVHVLPLEGVGEPCYDPARQELFCWAEGGGQQVRVALTYRACAPKALDTLAAALVGHWGRPRFLAGEVRKRARYFEIAPTAIAADRLVVPDLESETVDIKVAQGRAATKGQPLEERLEACGGLLEEAAHQGLRHLATSFADRLRYEAQEARGHGLADLARRLESLDKALKAAHEASSTEVWQDAAAAWTGAILQQRLCAEKL